MAAWCVRPRNWPKATASPRGWRRGPSPAAWKPPGTAQQNCIKPNANRNPETMTTEKSRKLFGTDGIRAVAGEPPLDAKTIYAAGLALAHSLRKAAAKNAPMPKVILGRDTRESSGWIAATLAAGLREAGARVESAGVITTPAVAFLARTHGFHAGVVISASHNPWRDNGIKLFGGDGFKLPDAVELAIEEEIFVHLGQITAPDPDKLPRVEDNRALAR